MLVFFMIFRTNKLLTSSKCVFLEDLEGMVKPEKAFWADLKGDQNAMAFNSTHYSLLSRSDIKFSYNYFS